jgi:hypothetical protein
MNKKICNECQYHDINNLYRDVCAKHEIELIIPDDVWNWILLRGCASYKKEKPAEGGGE